MTPAYVVIRNNTFQTITVNFTQKHYHQNQNHTLHIQMAVEIMNTVLLDSEKKTEYVTIQSQIKFISDSV